MPKLQNRSIFCRMFCSFVTGLLRAALRSGFLPLKRQAAKELNPAWPSRRQSIGRQAFASLALDFVNKFALIRGIPLRIEF